MCRNFSWIPKLYTEFNELWTDELKVIYKVFAFRIYVLIIIYTFFKPSLLNIALNPTVNLNSELYLVGSTNLKE